MLMWQEALLYVRAATQLSEHYRTPQLHLAAHGIELALKSFLRAKGYTLLQLRGLNHSLTRASTACAALGMESPSANVRLRLDFLSQAHVEQEFRYAHTDRPPHMDRPDWVVIAEWAIRAAIPAVAERTAPNALAVPGHIKAMEGWAAHTVGIGPP